MININKADDTVRKELEVQEKHYDEKLSMEKLRMCKESVNSVCGHDPQLHLARVRANYGGMGQLDLTRKQITDFARQFVKRYNRAPSLKEVIYAARIG